MTIEEFVASLNDEQIEALFSHFQALEDDIQDKYNESTLDVLVRQVDGLLDCLDLAALNRGFALEDEELEEDS